MGAVYEKIESCLKSVRERTDFVPEIAVVLGSGLGALADDVKEVCSISYSEIEGFPVSTVKGHKGRFVFGYLQEIPVAIMQGRVHFYEGYSMEEVVLPIRLLKKMGAQVLFLLNSAGGINETYKVGDFMLINDHISCFVPSPLMGQNEEELGVRFPDMSEIYCKKLRSCISNSFAKLNIPLQEGVYLQTTGPAYETPIEIKAFRTMGADAVGMSTACEAVAAIHMGMKVCGISCISNLAAGMTENALSHAEVQEMADQVAPLLRQGLKESILAIGNER